MPKTKNGLMIDPERVNAVFADCYYRAKELKSIKKDAKGIPKGAKVVEGVMGQHVFNPDRLASHSNEIIEWLKALPHQFHKNGGGGWSFLQACEQNNGIQWTGLHQRMDQLFTLGIGLGLVKFQLPREMWRALPGGMPYLIIET